MKLRRVEGQAVVAAPQGKPEFTETQDSDSGANNPAHFLNPQLLGTFCF